MSSPARTATPNLNERLEFIGLDASAIADLQRISPLVERHLGPALATFYNKLRVVPAVARFFSGNEQMDRAKSSQQGHWHAIAQGKLDDAYLAAATRVGFRHAQIGLEPRWYIGGYALILEGVLKGVIADYMAEHTPKRRFMSSTPAGLTPAQTAELSGGLAALVKAMLVDVDIAVTTYFDQLTERAAAQQQQSADKIAHAVSHTGDALRLLAQGDLTNRITAQFDVELGALKDDTNAVADSLAAIVTKLRQTSRSVRSATGEILSGANDLADRTTRQAATIEETSASMEQIASVVTDNARLTDEASAGIQSVVLAAEAGQTAVANATSAMDRIIDSSSRISGIIGLIDDIAFQTNLLALNASVEAARAGEAGKGFSVVAVEVRRLAQSAAEASREIKALIDASSVEVRAGAGLVADVAGRLGEIAKDIQRCSNLTTAIAQANRQQSGSIAEITVAVRQMDEMTQHNAALVEETNAAIEQTEAQATELDDIVDRFRLDDQVDQRSRQRRRA